MLSGFDMTDGAMSDGILKDYRILDLTWAAAGPFATELLAFLGAEVIKIESATRPDLLRRVVGQPADELDKSSRFNSRNLSKRSLRLNLQTAGGIRTLKELVTRSDALVENFRPGVVERLGISYGDLCAVKPDIVMISISAAGRGGPHSLHPGYASIFNAMGGLGYLTGYADGPPTEVRDSVDHRVGAVGAFALLAALFHRARSGRGQWVDISAREAVASVVGDALVEYQVTGISPGRRGNRLANCAPYGVYRCRGEDAWVAVAVCTDHEWIAICNVMGRPELAQKDRYANADARSLVQDELDSLVSDWCSTQTPQEIATACRARGVPCSPVMGAPELINDDHILARDLIRTVAHPLLGQQTVVAAPWIIDSGEPVVRPAPLLGADNDYVLRDLLGYSEQDIAELQSTNAFD